MVGIQVVVTAMVVVCVVVTGVLCTVLVATSGDEALKDTQDAGDEQVNKTLRVGREAVQNRTEEILDNLLDESIRYLLKFFEPHRMVAQSLAGEIMAHNFSTVIEWDWWKPSQIYWQLYMMRKSGNTGMGVFMSSLLSITFVEEGATLERDDNEYHSFSVFTNYGNTSVHGGFNKSFFASADITGRPRNVGPGLKGIEWNRSKCVDHDVNTNGAIPNDPCGRIGEYADPTQTSFYKIGNLINKGETWWLPPIIVGDRYISINALTPIHHGDERTGVAFSGIDLRRVSEFFTTIRIGDGRARIYATLRSNWLEEATGQLVGSSHGSVINETLGTVKSVFPNESNDDIIREITLNLEDSYDDLSAVNHSHQVDTVNGTFFYRVGILDDGFKINWHVHIAIDQDYLFGAMDEEFDNAKIFIEKSKSAVEANLLTARGTTYGVVTGVLIVLLIASMVLASIFVKPLLILKDDMSMVAVMRFTSIEGKSSYAYSSLNEVRDMQESFFCMAKRLREYRDFMPASVLKSDPSDFESDTMSSPSSSVPMTPPAQNGHSTTTGSVLSRQPYIPETAKTKKITISAINSLRFLEALPDSASLLSKVTKYLSVILTEVKNTRGTTDSFSGDRVFVSWNAVSQCPSHRVAAYQCLHGIHLELNKSVGFRGISSGICSGDLKCGNMGCEGMKRFSFFGSLASYVYVLEWLSRKLLAPLVIDNAVNEEVSLIAHTRILKHISFKKHSPRVLLTSQALHPKSYTPAEWMYQLQEGTANNPHRLYNTSYMYFISKDFEIAQEVLKDYTYADHIADEYRKLLEKAVANPDLADPLGSYEELLN